MVKKRFWDFEFANLCTVYGSIQKVTLPCFPEFLAVHVLTPVISCDIEGVCEHGRSTGEARVKLPSCPPSITWSNTNKTGFILNDHNNNSAHCRQIMNLARLLLPPIIYRPTNSQHWVEWCSSVSKPILHPLPITSPVDQHNSITVIYSVTQVCTLWQCQKKQLIQVEA